VLTQVQARSYIPFFLSKSWIATHSLRNGHFLLAGDAAATAT